MRPSIRRWGGNTTSTYHWKFDVDESRRRLVFEVLPETHRASEAAGGRRRSTRFSITPAPRARRRLEPYRCSSGCRRRGRNVQLRSRKYGKQCKSGPVRAVPSRHCGNGVKNETVCGDPSVNDGGPSEPAVTSRTTRTMRMRFSMRTSRRSGSATVVSRYGKSESGRGRDLGLDNEPIWWDNTHRDIHPDPYTYDELLGRGTCDMRQRSSKPIPRPWWPARRGQFASIWFSKKDIVGGQRAGELVSGSRGSERPWRHAADGLVPSAIPEYEQEHGVRLLDYYETHAYLAPGITPQSPPGFRPRVVGSDLRRARRLLDSRPGQQWCSAAPQIIPRLKAIIDANYPGTKLAITEYAYGALER